MAVTALWRTDKPAPAGNACQQSENERLQRFRTDEGISKKCRHTFSGAGLRNMTSGVRQDRDPPNGLHASACQVYPPTTRGVAR